MNSVRNLRPFWSYSLYKPPFRVRSGEVTLNCAKWFTASDFKPLSHAGLGLLDAVALPV